MPNKEDEEVWDRQHDSNVLRGHWTVVKKMLSRRAKNALAYNASVHATDALASEAAEDRWPNRTKMS